MLCIDLIFYCGKYALLYTIKNARGERSYYEGGNSKAFPSNKTLNSYWNRVPNFIKLFYQRLHDGFFYYASGAMGLVGENDVVRLADEDWGIIDDLSLEPPYDLASSFAFFATGAGRYCVLDTAKSDCENDSFLCFSASWPKYHINFWDVADEWILIGMDHYTLLRKAAPQAPPVEPFFCNASISSCGNAISAFLLCLSECCHIFRKQEWGLPCPAYEP